MQDERIAGDKNRRLHAPLGKVMQSTKPYSHTLTPVRCTRYVSFLTSSPFPREGRQNLLWRCYFTKGSPRYRWSKASSRDQRRCIRRVQRYRADRRAAFLCIDVPHCSLNSIRTCDFFLLLLPAKTSKPSAASASTMSNTPKNQTCLCPSIQCYSINHLPHLLGPSTMFLFLPWHRKLTD